MSPQEAGNTESFDFTRSDALSLLGIGTIAEIPCMSISWQVAQKLHACSDQSTNSYRNGRAHDLVDLMILETMVPEELLTNVNASCVAVFTSRARQTWPVTIEMHDHWERLYQRALEGLETLGFPSTCELAASQVNAFIRRIASSA